MPRNPAVSVLLPVRDGGQYLPIAMASLDRQTVDTFEVVAVDDGSTDGSGALLDRWARTDSRVRVIHTAPHGLVAALNTGLEACQAPLVARMDADDVCHPRRIELQLTLLDRHPEVGVASCLVRLFPRHAVAEGFRLYETWLNALVSPHDIVRERFIEAPVAHPSVIFRRELLVTTGGYRDLDWPEDYDLWLRLIEAGVVFAKVSRHLFFWREHGARLTRRHQRYDVARFLSCKAHFLLRGPLALRPRVIVWGAGKTGRLLTRQLLDGKLELAAFVDIDPAKISRTVRGAPVIPPEHLPEHLEPGTIVLAAVASRGARALIRTHLDRLGLGEGRDYWCVA